MLDMDIAHQTPLIPSPTVPKSTAKGTRSVLNVTLTIAGGMVRPTP